MNIKFRMPRWGSKLKGRPMLKEMAMTVIATTISIVLTFGSASVVEQRQKENNRRQTVMMVIHDIEDNIKVLKGWKSKEETNITLSNYVLSHLDEIDVISLDTLRQVYNYLLERKKGQQYVLDNSMEKLFQDNLSSWSSLDDNMKIIDQVQAFFNNRQSQLDSMNNSPFWTCPITQQENLSYLCEGSKHGCPIKINQIVKEKLNDSRVRFFLQYSPDRQLAYENMVDAWQNKADKLKFMIGVTDKELKSFIEAHQQFGRIAEKKDIIGEWVKVDSMRGYLHVIFDSDNSFLWRNRLEKRHSIYSGKIIGIHSYEGKWEFKGDTLIETFNPNSYAYCMDASRIQYSEKMFESVFSDLELGPLQQKGMMMRDTVNAYIKDLKQWYEDLNKKYFTKVSKRVLRIDESGDKMEVTCLDKDNKASLMYFLMRKSENK